MVSGAADMANGMRMGRERRGMGRRGYDESSGDRRDRECRGKRKGASGSAVEYIKVDDKEVLAGKVRRCEGPRGDTGGTAATFFACFRLASLHTHQTQMLAPTHAHGSSQRAHTRTKGVGWMPLSVAGTDSAEREKKKSVSVSVCVTVTVWWVAFG